MIVVIQCAASKRPDAGHLIAANGKLVDFVAQPQIAPRDPDRVYARPDDLCEDGISWRQHLLKYNDNPGDNPLRLYPAYQLYENKRGFNFPAHRNLRVSEEVENLLR
jgi:hypothetical protein